MACAGYLVWNNTAVVYAEVATGVLVCSSSARRHAVTCGETPVLANGESAGDADATPSNNMLPLLAPKHMARSESPALSKLKRQRTHPQPEEEDDVDTAGDERKRYSSASDESSASDDDAGSRMLRLCGHVVEVVDCDDDRYDALPILPFSFRVNTKKLTLHDDASFSTTPVDSLLLAAVDQKAKDEWMKRLARWNRYGWRETTDIAATEADCEALQVTMTRWHEALAHTLGQASVYATSTPSRRRFYRPSIVGVMDDSMAEGDPWFHMRVIKTQTT